MSMTIEEENALQEMESQLAAARAQIESYEKAPLGECFSCKEPVCEHVMRQIKVREERVLKAESNIHSCNGKVIESLEADLASAQSDAKVNQAAYEAVKTIGHRLESELAAAKVEIGKIKEQLQLANTDNFETEGRCFEWEQRNKRLRETIQRNEDKSVECERLREALNIYANEDNWGRSDDGWVDWNSDEKIPFKKGDPYDGGASIARAALDGGKPSMPEPTHGGPAGDGGKA